VKQTWPAATSSTSNKLIDSLDRAIRVLALVAALSGLIGFCLAVFQAPLTIQNDHRLGPTFAVAHGYRLYYGPQQGPVLSTIYGPITALAYAPTLLASTPMGAVRLGTVITILLFLFPMFLVAGKGTDRGSSRLILYDGIWGANFDWQWYLSVLGLAVSLIALSISLGMSSVLIHADAPALAAGGVACWLSGAKGSEASWRRALLGGVFAGIAAMAKQNMVPLGFALVLWWLVISWRSALAFAGGVAACLLGIWTGILAVSSSLQAAWFNWFKMPTSQPYDKAMLFPIVDELYRTLLLLVLLIAAMLWRYLRQPDGSTWRARSRPLSLLLLWAGCWLIPTSVLGRIKLGGNENGLSPAIYFFALACMLELSAFFFKSRPSARPGSALLALSLLLGSYVVMKLPENFYSAFKTYSAYKASGPSAMEIVYKFSRSHPGEMYFPQFPLAILMSEGRLYDFSWGLSDRREAGYPVSDAQFLTDTPPTANRMALMSWVPYYDKDITARCVAGTESQDPALPGFTICRFRPDR
jgi:hypothetical protein